jgi:hypothetical protein
MEGPDGTLNPGRTMIAEFTSAYVGHIDGGAS